MPPRKPPKEPEQRLARWSRSMSPGTLNGRVASATPMGLDLSRLAPRMRSQPQPAGNNFDPNEDPVIIGAGATSGSGTPDQPSAGAATAVAIGSAAAAPIQFAVAVGTNSQALTDSSLAIGAAATVSGAWGIAVGPGATAAYDESVAIGHGAQTSELGQILLGHGAGHFIAMGTTAGNRNGVVFKDTSTGDIMLLTVASGALVVSGPV